MRLDTGTGFPGEAADSDGRGFARGLALVLGAVIVYCALHAGFRLLASQVLGEDDVVEAVFSQELRAGYDAFPRQPPLYNWVLYGLQQVMGLGIETFLVIKYAALAVTALLVYSAAYLAYRGDRLFAVLSVESLALIYQIAWRYHEGFTHEVLAMVAVMATLNLVFLIVREPRLTFFAALGVAMGFGFLTEPTYYVFFFCLLAAVSLQPAARQAIWRPSFAVSAVIALALAAPYFHWVLSSPQRIAGWLHLIQPFAAHTLDGLWDAFRGPFAYLSPLIVILPLMFPGFLRTAWGDLKRGPEQGPRADLEQLALHGALIAFGAALFASAFLGIKEAAIHVLMPLYLPIVVWLFGVARRSSAGPLHIARFTRLALAIAIFAFCARMANMFVLDPVCKTCRWGIPYAGLAAEMRARGFPETGTIVSLDKETAGNLRVLFPQAAVATRGYPNFTPNAARIGVGPTVFVWPKTGAFPMQIAERHIRPLLPEGTGLDAMEQVVVPWRHLWRETGYRTSTWRMLVTGVAEGSRGDVAGAGSRPAASDQR